MSEPSAATKRRVWGRARGRCERCGCEVGWLAYSFHHRRLRGQGGDRRPDTHSVQNLLLLCGSGTTGCHGWVHHDTTGLCREQGYIVSRWADPLEQPVRSFLAGWTLLGPDGEYLSEAGEWDPFNEREPSPEGGPSC